MSSPSGTTEPLLSVVVPTYNRSGFLRTLLGQLTGQSLPVSDFEVVVSDDGSSDDTKAVVDSFADRLRLKYHFQEDLGFRAAEARNAGARLATGPILVFMDTGTLVGPDYLAHHLAAHRDADRPHAVVGYAYGYNPEAPMPGLADILAAHGPEEVLARHRDDPAFLDVRHGLLEGCDFDLNRRAVPWMFFWTNNCSMRTADFWAIGGFDEGFSGWGVEDLDLGFRVHRHGLPFLVSRDAWVIESPHDRDVESNWRQFRLNIGQFLDKFPEPVIEVGYMLVQKLRLFDWDEEYRRVLDAAEATRTLDVSGELSAAAAGLPAGARIVVFGAGGNVPDSLPPATLLDHDRELLDKALASGVHTGHHAIGLRTPLADGSADVVVITSRLAVLWDRWGDEVLAEARRIGRTVRLAGTV